jgi:hypothetical protein
MLAECYPTEKSGILKIRVAYICVSLRMSWLNESANLAVFLRKEILRTKTIERFLAMRVDVGI